MGNGKLTEHAQNLQGCEKCNLRKAVGNLEFKFTNIIVKSRAINPNKMDSLINLDKWCPSLPPYYFEGIVVEGVVSLVIMMMNR